MTDVLLFQTNDDGDVNVTAQGLELTQGLETATYLSLFGGNECEARWWGDTLEADPVKRYPALTAKAINEAVVTPSRLLPVKDAVLADLAWLSQGFAESVEVSVSIPNVNTVRISVNIDGQILDFTETGPSA